MTELYSVRHLVFNGFELISQQVRAGMDAAVRGPRSG